MSPFKKGSSLVHKEGLIQTGLLFWASKLKDVDNFYAAISI